MYCSDESILAIATSKLMKNFHLKEEQKLAIKEICDGKDILAILPTRFGKSLIYSLIPICMNHLKKEDAHIVLVISPFIALMEDQVNALGSYGITSVFINENKKTVSVNRNFSLLFKVTMSIRDRQMYLMPDEDQYRTGKVTAVQFYSNRIMKKIQFQCSAWFQYVDTPEGSYSLSPPDHMSEMSALEHKLKRSAIALNCWADDQDFVAIK